MEAGEGGRAPPAIFCRILQQVVLSLIILIAVADAQNCESPVPLPVGVTNIVTVEKCQDVWVDRNFTLRFKQDLTAKTLSIVLSVPKDNRWYAIGFNKNPGSMVESSALVGWVNPTSGATNLTAYYLASKDSSGVRPDSTRLAFKSKPFVISDQDTLHLSFVIDQAKSTASFDYQVLAVGSEGDIPLSDGSFNQHDASNPVSVNFQSGSVVYVEDNTPRLAKVHGFVNIFGWGILLPAGAIIARYAKAFDPAWFYAHAVCQGIGFGFIIAGLATGTDLVKKLPGVSVKDHRNLGIFLFVVAIWQVTALLIRPKKEAKMRRYWNWGHWWLGRIGLFLAAVNVFVGIDVTNGSRRSKAGYAIVIALELLLVIVLESLLWIKYLRHSDSPQLPQVSMQRRNPSFEPSSPPRAPPPPYESTNWDNHGKY